MPQVCRRPVRDAGERTGCRSGHPWAPGRARPGRRAAPCQPRRRRQTVRDRMRVESPCRPTEAGTRSEWFHMNDTGGQPDRNDSGHRAVPPPRVDDEAPLMPPAAGVDKKAWGRSGLTTFCNSVAVERSLITTVRSLPRTRTSDRLSSRNPARPPCHEATSDQRKDTTIPAAAATCEQHRFIRLPPRARSGWVLSGRRARAGARDRTG